jgi:hypothetical protein
MSLVRIELPPEVRDMHLDGSLAAGVIRAHHNPNKRG